jgi:hypothetical protein
MPGERDRFNPAVRAARSRVCQSAGGNEVQVALDAVAAILNLVKAPSDFGPTFRHVAFDTGE